MAPPPGVSHKPRTEVSVGGVVPQEDDVTLSGIPLLPPVTRALSSAPDSNQVPPTAHPVVDAAT